MIIFLCIFGLIFVVTGILIVLLDTYQSPNRFDAIRPLQTLIFGTHMYLWMLAGMFANYLWEFYLKHNSLNGLPLGFLFLQILVSPIIFHSVWSMWKNRQIEFVLHLIAFQNGFFWQVVFTKIKETI